MALFGRARGRGRRATRDADAAMREALRRVLDGDADAAEALLAGAVRADSEDPGAYLALAGLYRSRGEIGRAIRMHQNLLLRRELDAETRDEALLGLAADFQKGGFLQRAIAAYEELLERRPRERSALRALVRLHADVRAHDRAIELARRLARVEGRDGRVEEAGLWVESAEAAHAEGRSDDARRAVKRALRRDARNTRAWSLLGALEAERGRAKRALAAWRRVPEIDRRSGPALYGRIEATYAAVGRPREYESFLGELLERRPSDVEARLALAHALSARGATKEAAAEIQRVLERDGESLRAHAALARLRLGEQDERGALEGLRSLLDVLERRGWLVPPESVD